MNYCEDCNYTFCMSCRAPTDDICHKHSVTLVSTAEKHLRMVLFYRLNYYNTELNKCEKTINDELDLLDMYASNVNKHIAETFEQMEKIVKERHDELINNVTRVRNRKNKILSDQVESIRLQRNYVNSAFNYRPTIEVGEISRKVDDINSILESMTGLVEPLENYFIRYTSDPTFFPLVIDPFGQIVKSLTSPSHSRLYVPTICVHLTATITLQACDSEGEVVKHGNDPVCVTLTDSKHNRSIKFELTDHENGVYSIVFTPQSDHPIVLGVEIFARQVSSCPRIIVPTNHINPISVVGESNQKRRQFIQPSGVVCHISSRTNVGSVVVLDSGHRQVKFLDPETLKVTSRCSVDVGSTSVVSSQNLVCVSSWSTNRVTVFEIGDNSQSATKVRHISSHSINLQEVTCAAIMPGGKLILADTRIGALVITHLNIDADSEETNEKDKDETREQVSDAGPGPGGREQVVSVRTKLWKRFPLITDILVIDEENVLVLQKYIWYVNVTTGSLSKIHFNNKAVVWKMCRSNGKGGGQRENQQEDRDSSSANSTRARRNSLKNLLLATCTTFSKSFIQIFDLNSFDPLYQIDSNDDKLILPMGLATIGDRVYVSDVVKNQIKVYRYQ